MGNCGPTWHLKFQKHPKKELLGACAGLAGLGKHTGNYNSIDIKLDILDISIGHVHKRYLINIP